MNTLQQIIDNINAERRDAIRAELKYQESDKRLSGFFAGKAEASLRHIRLLESLLNEQPEAITEDSPHLRKHDVGRSAASNDISTKGNDLSESSSETQAVGQNEQTVKVIHCSCKNSKGWTEVKCCNDCGLPIESWWNNG